MHISISVPDEEKIKVKTGDKINFATPLYETKAVIHHSVMIAQKLKVKPEKIFRYLKKFVGEEVKKGEILAVKKGLFSTQKIICEYDGIIKEINHEDGLLIIDSSGDKKTIFSQIIGEVEGIKNHQITIKIKEGKSYPLKKATADFGAETFYWENNDEKFIFYNDIAKKIIVGETLSSYAQTKMEALDILGYVLLTKLPSDTSLPFCQIKNISDLNEIMKQRYPYCYVDAKSGRIIFYK